MWKNVCVEKQGITIYFFLRCPKVNFGSFSSGQSHSHCVKNVQIRSYFWSVFSCIRTEYGDLLRNTGIQENTEKKQLRIWTLFTQCYEMSITALLLICPVAHVYDCIITNSTGRSLEA